MKGHLEMVPMEEPHLVAFPSGGPPGPPGPQRPPSSQGPEGLQGPPGSQGLSNGGHRDPNINFNTMGLETSLTDLSRYMLHLFNVLQVANQHLHQQMQLNNTTQQVF